MCLYSWLSEIRTQTNFIHLVVEIGSFWHGCKWSLPSGLPLPLTKAGPSDLPVQWIEPAKVMGPYFRDKATKDCDFHLGTLLCFSDKTRCLVNCRKERSTWQELRTTSRYKRGEGLKPSDQQPLRNWILPTPHKWTWKQIPVPLEMTAPWQCLQAAESLSLWPTEMEMEIMNVILNYKFPGKLVTRQKITNPVVMSPESL